MTSLGTLFRGQRSLYVRDLLRELVVRDIKLRYKRSILGMAWSLLNPLFQLVVLVFIFQRALRLDIPNYASFAFTGVLAYNWFQTALFEAAMSITGNRDLVRRPGFPGAILPLTAVTTNFIHFLLAMPILFAFILISGERLTAAILALPLVILLEFMLILGLGYLIAPAQVTYRDTQHLLGVFLRLLFFLTPVFYSASAIPEQYQWLYRLNPMAHLIGAYRTILLDGSLPDLRTLLVLAAFCTGLLWLGYTVYVRASHRIVDEL